MSALIDMKGKKFGELVVKNITNQRRISDRSVLWLAQCSCGKEKLLPRSLLLKYKSCGCKRKEYQSINLRKTLNKGGYKEIFATHWNGIRKNALSRDLKFDINVKYAWKLFLKQNRKCKLTGVPIQFSTKCWSKDATASLDRINSTKGYTKDNVQWVHKEINMMKQQYKTEKFFDWCKKIVEYNKL
jgi:hypothetical protein